MPQVYLSDIIASYNENRENDTCNDYDIISVEDFSEILD